jgi:hypothetical protein
MDQVIADAIETYETQEFWREVRDGFARLHGDPVAWADYQREFEEWENATIADGLEPEEWTDADFLIPPSASTAR